MSLPFDFICPGGAHINKFIIGSGAVINNIQATCSDKKTVSPVFGGPGDNRGVAGAPLGFDAAKGEIGKYLDYLILGNEKDPVMFGSKNPTMDPGSKKTLDVKCNPGDVIVGIKGNATPNLFVEDLQFYCGKPEGTVVPSIPIPLIPLVGPLVLIRNVDDKSYVMWVVVAAIILVGLFFVMSKGKKSRT